MKHLSITLILLVSVALISCNSNVSAQQSQLLEAKDFKEKINEDVHLIDVRTAREYKQGHIKGAVNIDYMSSDFAEQIEKLDTSKPIVIYCRTGRRSGLSTKVIVQAGFKEIYDLKGGTVNWTKKGFALDN